MRKWGETHLPPLIACLLIIGSLSGCLEEQAANQKPTIFLDPLPTTVSGIVNITGTAADADGTVERVEISIIPANATQEQWGYANGTTSWYYSWNTTAVDNGVYHLRCRSYDGRDYSTTYSIMLTVNNTAINHPPVAAFTFSVDGLTVQFTDNSHDEDNDTLMYHWDFGDGTNPPEATAQNPAHVYASDGTYTVTLSVSDGLATDELQTNITVAGTPQNTPPSCSLSASPNVGYAPQTVTFSLIATDIDGYISLWQLDIDNDGTPEYSASGAVPSTQQHLYQHAGTYTAKLTVTDDDGATGIATATVTILEVIPNQPPTAHFSYTPTNPMVDENVTFNATLSTDSDGEIVQYAWSYQGSGGQFPEFMGYGQLFSYNWSHAGTYNVTLTVTDDDGATDEITIQIIVTDKNVSNFSIACWNLQVFGPTKASNETLLTYYADKLDDYDLFIVQEIRDKSGMAIVALANKLPEYSYIISERAGTTSSKEQYAIFYNSRATLVSQHDWTPEKQDEFERPPFQATFTVSNWTFTLYTIHTKPANVPTELTHLENLTGAPATDTIILGDLNADGSYYDEDNIQHFITWSWVITNDMDTTVAASNNTYDRIIINQATNNNFINASVMNDVDSSQSDHYLVYAVFNPGLP